MITHASDLIFYTNSLSFQMKNVGNAIKISALVVIWIVFTVTLMSRDEKELAYQPISVPVGAHKSNGNFYEKKTDFLEEKKNRTDYFNFSVYFSL